MLPHARYNARVPLAICDAWMPAAMLLCSCTGGQDATVHEFHPDASCPVTIASYPLLAAMHVAIPSNIQWNSNPPSSGPHYPVWAAYGQSHAPVPRGYYVHDLEHGAIVLLYNCGDAGCADVVAALHAVSDAIPDDPLCIGARQGVRVRTVITSDPLIDAPVAAAAWGWTYVAECVDFATLEQFALEHYGHGPESTCGDGLPF
jgi:hypothetical protein